MHQVCGRSSVSALGNNKKREVSGSRRIANRNDFPGRVELCGLRQSDPVRARPASYQYATPPGYISFSQNSSEFHGRPFCRLAVSAGKTLNRGVRCCPIRRIAQRLALAARHWGLAGCGPGLSKAGRRRIQLPLAAAGLVAGGRRQAGASGRAMQQAKTGMSFILGDARIGYAVTRARARAEETACAGRDRSRRSVEDSPLWRGDRDVR